MDPLDGLLNGPHAREAFLLRSRMAAPWSLAVRDEAPLTVLAVVRGTTWLDADGVSARLVPGDVAVLRRQPSYTVADEPGRPLQAVILPGQVCAAPDGGPQDVMGPVGVRAWGNAADGATELLTGTYTTERAVSAGLLAALPTTLMLRADGFDSPLPRLLADEIGRDDPGQVAVLDRLLDLLVVAALRAWFARSPAPGWYAAHDDPVAGPALRVLQDDPAEAWTLAGLAAAVGVSRATLARRFTERVGEPPMTFLTGYRLALAADLLRESDATLAAIARRVGYGGPFALSTAFRRRHGLSPQEYRARH